MDEGVDHVARLEGRSLRDVLEPELVERRVLGHRRALEVEEVADLEVQVDQQVAGRDEPLAVDQGGGRELAHHRGRHQRPGLHEEARLHRPGRRVEREVDDGVAVLQGAVDGVEQRGLRAVAVGSVPGGLRDHRRLAVVAGVHRRVDEDPGLAGLLGVEPEGAAVGVGVPVADRPLRRFALAVAAEVAVAVDEVADGVGVLLQRPEDLRAGGDPVRRGDHALEAQPAQELVRVAVEPALAFDEEPGRVLVAGGLLVEHVPEGPEPHASLGRSVAVDLLPAPRP